MIEAECASPRRGAATCAHGNFAEESALPKLAWRFDPGKLSLHEAHGVDAPTSSATSLLRAAASYVDAVWSEVDAASLRYELIASCEAPTDLRFRVGL